MKSDAMPVHSVGLFIRIVLISSGDTAEIRLNLSEHTVLVISNNIDITASFLPRQILSLLTQLLAYSLYVPARTFRTSSSCYKRELPH